jgi:hypothetical protein
MEAEADCFLLHDLRDWIRKERCLDAVKTHFETTTTIPETQVRVKNQSRGEADVRVCEPF